MPSLAESLRHAQAFYEAGEWERAERLCTSILQLQPQQLDAIKLLGIIAAQSRRAPQALELLGRLVAARPDDPVAHNNYANVLRVLQRLDDALQSYERALRLKPDYAEAHSNRGGALLQLGRFADALQSCERALQFRPDYVQAHVNRGTALRELRRFDAAFECYERALQLKPDYSEAHALRGSVLQKLGRFEEALRSYERALQLKPDYAAAHLNRGSALQEFGRFGEARESYERALQLKPDYAEVYSNLGAWHYLRNEPEAAVVDLNRAIDIQPDLAVAYMNRAYAELLAGDLESGWVDHEWRWKAMPHLLDPRYPDRTRWHGLESLTGKTIVLHSEQGLGDTLQFSRYAKPVADLGATVILEVQSPLATLLANLEGLSQLVVRGEPLPSFDYHCPLMSLPLAFRTSLSTVPARVPYIRSDSLKTRLWKEKLGASTKLRVGLVWSGGFRRGQPELWSVNRRRNVPLAKLAALRNSDVTFYSLQKGRAAQAELTELKAVGWPGPELIDFTESLRDFSDTAALMENLDLVISVDTSTAHLAGAMAKPVWIMNRFDGCWRWLLNRTDSPWYPTARLYRQQRAGDWDEVVERIRIDLCKTIFDRATAEAAPQAEAQP
jgi:tetratricopeptide (TPR) repeat protein